MWVGGYGLEEEECEEDILPWEPAGHGQIATDNETICQEFWRTFVRNSVVMDWI